MKFWHAFYLLIFSSALYAQSNAQVTTIPESNIASFNLRFYPISLITGIKGEVGFRLQNANVEINIEGKYYYRDFFWRTKTQSSLPTLFYPQVNGGHVFLNIETRMKKDRFSYGGSLGYKSVLSDAIDLSSHATYPGAPQTAMIINEQQYYGLFLIRLRSHNKGFFFEFVAKAGAVYNYLDQTKSTVISEVDSFDSKEVKSYLFPYASLGINLGFGW